MYTIVFRQSNDQGKCNYTCKNRYRYINELLGENDNIKV